MGNPVSTPILAVLGVKHPKTMMVKYLTPKGTAIREFASFELFCAHLARCVCSVGVPGSKKERKSHTTRTFYPLAEAWPLIPNGPNLAGFVHYRTWLVNHHTHFHVNCLEEAAGLAGVVGRPICTTTPVDFNTAAQLCCLVHSCAAVTVITFERILWFY